jgi:hypothetical protein
MTRFSSTAIRADSAVMQLVRHHFAVIELKLGFEMTRREIAIDLGFGINSKKMKSSNDINAILMSEV